MNIDKLEKLIELKEEGIITQEEFDGEKKILMSEDEVLTDDNENSDEEGVNDVMDFILRWVGAFILTIFLMFISKHIIMPIAERM